jgi:hypothetical protein
MTRSQGVAICLGAFLMSAPCFGLRIVENANEFLYHGRIFAGGAIEIKGVNGDVAAEPSSSGEVEVLAVKEGSLSNPEQVRIEVVEHDGGATICAIYPESEFKLRNTCAPGEGGDLSVYNNDVFVQFTVRVPHHVRFVGRTANGRVSAKGLRGGVEAHTVNGNVDIEETSGAKVKTVNGSIRAALDPAAHHRPVDLESVNGNVTVKLAPSAGVELEATTVNGGIANQLLLAQQFDVTPQHVAGRTGCAAGPRIEVRTVNGDIRLEQSN